MCKACKAPAGSNEDLWEEDKQGSVEINPIEEAFNMKPATTHPPQEVIDEAKKYMTHGEDYIQFGNQVIMFLCPEDADKFPPELWEKMQVCFNE